MPDRGPVPVRRHRRASAAVAAAAAVLGAGLVLAGVHRGTEAAQAGRTPTQRPSALRTAAPAPPPAELRAPWRPGAPRRVRIAALGVDAPVVPVRAPGRTLVPPRDPGQLGWWADGVRPGARHGSVLITGHTVHGSAEGALERIGELRRGATVDVVSRREPVRYVVVRVRAFSKAALARRAANLFRQRGAPRLVLITCTGWDGHRYLGNVVAIARPATAVE